MQARQPTEIQYNIIKNSIIWQAVIASRFETPERRHARSCEPGQRGRQFSVACLAQYRRFEGAGDRPDQLHLLRHREQTDKPGGGVPPGFRLSQSRRPEAACRAALLSCYLPNSSSYFPQPIPCYRHDWPSSRDRISKRNRLSVSLPQALQRISDISI